jgi:hypothetical protein
MIDFTFLTTVTINWLNHSGSKNRTGNVYSTVVMFGDILMARVFIAASGRSCDRPTLSGFPLVFFDTRAHAQLVTKFHFVRFEVFTAVTMKNGVFGDVTPCGSCKNLTSQKTPFFKFHFALLDSHAAFPIATSRFRPHKSLHS